MGSYAINNSIQNRFLWFLLQVFRHDKKKLKQINLHWNKSRFCNVLKAILFMYLFDGHKVSFKSNVLPIVSYSMHGFIHILNDWVNDSVSLSLGQWLVLTMNESEFNHLFTNQLNEWFKWLTQNFTFWWKNVQKDSPENPHHYWLILYQHSDE